MSLWLVLGSFLLLGSLACTDKPLQNPELQDPIYKDLAQRLKTTQDELKTFANRVEASRKDIAKALPNSMELRKYKAEHRKSKKSHAETLQKTQYLSLKLEERKHSSRKAYITAYKNKQEWPDVREFNEYKKNRELREASRSWSKRVPHFGDRYGSPKGDNEAPTHIGPKTPE